ncbi:hypothetical protein ACRALDRAFT_1095042 [Sodiomyces alcalophilus JCM 7366]|uniref:uncharacterized protein n=1 Tax=Sodiomyces alcalophilus JCM 7366 TaxID=591952 RepID=UPI0039B3B5D0
MTSTGTSIRVLLSKTYNVFLSPHSCLPDAWPFPQSIILQLDGVAMPETGSHVNYGIPASVKHGNSKLDIRHPRRQPRSEHEICSRDLGHCLPRCSFPTQGLIAALGDNRLTATKGAVLARLMFPRMTKENKAPVKDLKTLGSETSAVGLAFGPDCGSSQRRWTMEIWLADVLPALERMTYLQRILAVCDVEAMARGIATRTAPLASWNAVARDPALLKTSDKRPRQPHVNPKEEVHIKSITVIIVLRFSPTDTGTVPFAATRSFFYTSPGDVVAVLPTLYEDADDEEGIRMGQPKGAPGGCNGESSHIDRYPFHPKGVVEDAADVIEQLRGARVTYAAPETQSTMPMARRILLSRFLVLRRAPAGTWSYECASRTLKVIGFDGRRSSFGGDVDEFYLSAVRPIRSPLRTSRKPFMWNGGAQYPLWKGSELPRSNLSWSNNVNNRVASAINMDMDESRRRTFSDSL